MPSTTVWSRSVSRSSPSPRRCRGACESAGSPIPTAPASASSRSQRTTPSAGGSTDRCSVLGAEGAGAGDVDVLVEDAAGALVGAVVELVPLDVEADTEDEQDADQQEPSPLLLHGAEDEDDG